MSQIIIPVIVIVMMEKDGRDLQIMSKNTNHQIGIAKNRMKGKHRIILNAQLLDLMIRNSKRNGTWKSKLDDRGEFIRLMECLGLYVWGDDPKDKTGLDGWGLYMTKLGYDVFKLLDKKKWFRNKLWKLNEDSLA